MSMYTNDDIMDKLNELELKIDNIESKVDSLDNNLKKHIKFIDKTYEGLKTPIATATRFLRGR